ncbi:SpoIIE family protein phosphatase [Synechococcus sp. Nb3U1]|uniref:PP2C family protein-serine/threonine phosphatase n=1 Tax=Synechococcus sp. Nb3U1 TaxID=1914529 RepID=UPI001F2A7581|nr:GAF domain-containing SpoIIE family protein phosphatase [Synechococcus sp. Nb3U1]MCF2969636.1 SpoIIE family protein phosphatase [Synechococcus sp. Nb3U1]
MDDHSPKQATSSQPQVGLSGSPWSEKVSAQVSDSGLFPVNPISQPLPSEDDLGDLRSAQVGPEEEPTCPPGISPDAIELPEVNPAIVPVPAMRDPLADLGQEQRRVQDWFGALAFALRSFNNLNQILELTAFVASQLTDAEGGALVLFNPNGTIQLEQLHCSDLNRRDQIRAEMERITQNLSTQERSTPTAGSLSVEIPALERLLDERLRQKLGPDVQLFGTPLLIRTSVRGRLYVFSRQPDYRWDERRQQMLRVIADQAAVAIENDELTAALRRRVALEKEMEIGSYIQTQLLPREYPQVRGLKLAARCRVASKVGGDYYDFIVIPMEGSATDPEAGAQPGSRSPEEIEDFRLGIVIGDVMGKGVPAGMLMSMTRAMVRAEALNRHSPARVLQRLNRAMYSDLENSNRFISLFYSEYDPRSHRLCYSNAAHNPTLWWHARTQEIQALDTDGALIGLEGHSHYSENCVQLQPGDVVVYYTDGYTEAANTHGERLETAGLMKALQQAARRYDSPQDILESLFEQMDSFRGRQGSSLALVPSYDPELLLQEDIYVRPESVDDTTLVVLKLLADSAES